MTEPLVVLLHGWPGLPSDYDRVRALLPGVRCVAPALAGIGEGFEGAMPTGSASADAHAQRLLAALPGGVPLLLVGYDIGSRIAQAMMRADASRIVGAVLTPGYPGIGARAAAGDLASRFWYQHFHRTPVAARLVDGREDAVRDYLGFLVESWAASDEPVRTPRFDEVVAAYARPGAFAASIAWYRDTVGYAGGRPTSIPTTMLWPERDPLFPIAWADELETWFTDVALRVVPGGHFVPLESPEAMARAIADRLGR
ncbi:alpha/beta hydrolase [Agrococcus versicolor]|uniref:Alpha/beta hydrolase n=1 Tax=Agrococcus versicolor TaxID=501482 RepID=A0ABN3AML1_9MICO